MMFSLVSVRNFHLIQLNKLRQKQAKTTINKISGFLNINLQVGLNAPHMIPSRKKRRLFLFLLVAFGMMGKLRVNNIQ